MDDAAEASSQSPPWPAPVIIPPISGQHTHTMILLHGLGNNGAKFSRELLSTGLTSSHQNLATLFPQTKFIFPTAQWCRSSAFKRIRLTQWFDVYRLDDPEMRREEQVNGLVQSARYIRDIIVKEKECVGSGNIVLGGISMGAAMGMVVLLGLKVRIGGFVGACGWLPFRGDVVEAGLRGMEGGGMMGGEEEVMFEFGDDEDDDRPPEELSPIVRALNVVRDVLSLEQITTTDSTAAAAMACLQTPVFLGHGARDEKVPCHLGEAAAQTLMALGVDVTWKRYPELGHWFQVPEEIDDIVVFLRDKAGLQGL